MSRNWEAAPLIDATIADTTPDGHGGAALSTIESLIASATSEYPKLKQGADLLANCRQLRMTQVQ